MWIHSTEWLDLVATPLLSYTRNSPALFALSPLLVITLFLPINHCKLTLYFNRCFCCTSARSIISSKNPLKIAFSFNLCSLCIYHLIFLERSIRVWMGSSNCRFFYPMHSWCATVNMLYLFLNNQALLLEHLSSLNSLELPLLSPGLANSTL